MKLKRLIPLSVIVVGLNACSWFSPPATQHNQSLDSADHSLAEASFAVSRSISTLSEVAQAAHPFKLDPPPSPASYDMAQLSSVDWSGPVEPLVQQIAKMSNYRLRVLGRPPAIPVLVTVYDKNMMLGDILRDVGYQAAKRATIVVFTDSRVIELRYASN